MDTTNYIKDINIEELFLKPNPESMVRNEVSYVMDYLQTNTASVFLALQGLPGTGQDFIVQQVLQEMSSDMLHHTKFLEILPESRWTHVYFSICHDIEAGFQYFFLKDLANQNCYQYVAQYLSEFVRKNNIRIVIYGDNPAAMLLRVHDEDFDEKIICTNTSYIPYASDLLTTHTDNLVSFFDYLKHGPIIQRHISNASEQVKQYIEQISINTINAWIREDEWGDWSEPLIDAHSVDALQNTIINMIYHTVADVAYDCICYASMKHCDITVTMQIAEKILPKINSVLKLPRADIQSEIRSNILAEYHYQSSLFSPAEIENIIKKEFTTAQLKLIGAMKCATLQLCSVNAVKYHLPEKQHIMVAFQNTGFLYTLVQDIFQTIKTDGLITTTLNENVQKTISFWNDCEELLLCRLATHNLINDLKYKALASTKESGTNIKISILKYGFFDIINKIDVQKNAKSIVIVPPDQLEAAKEIRWNFDILQKIRNLYGNPLDITICNTKDILLTPLTI